MAVTTRSGLVEEAITELKTEIEFSNLRLVYLETHEELNNLSKVFWVEYHRYITTHLAELKEWQEVLGDNPIISPEWQFANQILTTKTNRLLGINE